MKQTSQNQTNKKLSNHNKNSQLQIFESHPKQSDSQYNKQIQFIMKQEQRPNVFEFTKIERDVQRIAELMIDEILKDRNTILLAKIAKENILQCETNGNKGTYSYHSSIKEIQDPLIMKSLDEINQFYCTEISSKVVKKIVQYLKLNELFAKVMVAGIIIENPKFGFNIAGMCFWNNLSDGQKTIRRKIPALRGCFRGNLKQGTSYQQKSSTLQSRSDQFDRQGLLVVTIYLCKFQRKFRNK